MPRESIIANPRLKNRSTSGWASREANRWGKRPRKTNEVAGAASALSRLCWTRQTNHRRRPSLVDMMKLITRTCCWLAIAGAATLSAQSTPISTTPATIAPPRLSPQQHLTDAEAVLASVSETSMPSSAKKNFSQLRKDFSTLTSSYAEAQPKTAVWQSNLSDVERDLVRLIGSGSATLKVEDQKDLRALAAEVSDSATRASLEAFRTHVELFLDAATTRDPGKLTPPSAPGSIS